jgi:hypothetical protein
MCVEQGKIKLVIKFVCTASKGPYKHKRKQARYEQKTLDKEKLKEK